MRPSSPRSSRISSTTARYSVSSSRILSPVGVSSGRSSTSTKSRPSGRVSAAPAIPRCSPLRATAWAPPGRRTRSVTSATTPTLAYSPSRLGTRSTRSSSPTSTVRVTFILGKTTMSSRGTSSSLLTTGSRSSLQIGSALQASNFKKCTAIPADADSRPQLLRNAHKPPAARRVSRGGAAFRPSPPGSPATTSQTAARSEGADRCVAWRASARGRRPPFLCRRTSASRKCGNPLARVPAARKVPEAGHLRCPVTPPFSLQADFAPRRRGTHSRGSPPRERSLRSRAPTVPCDPSLLDSWMRH